MTTKYILVRFLIENDLLAYFNTTPTTEGCIANGAPHTYKMTI